MDLITMTNDEHAERDDAPQPAHTDARDHNCAPARGGLDEPEGSDGPGEPDEFDFLTGQRGSFVGGEIEWDDFAENGDPLDEESGTAVVIGAYEPDDQYGSDEPNDEEMGEDAYDLALSGMIMGGGSGLVSGRRWIPYVQRSDVPEDIGRAPTDAWTVPRE